MKNRLLALVCLIAVLIGVFAVGVTATNQTENSYLVGYTKIDLNPWVQTKTVDFLNPSVSGSIGIPVNDAWGQGTEDTDTINTITIDNPNGSGTLNVPLVGVRLAGFGSAYDNHADSLLDDNCDGKIGKGDGIFATATTVTDNEGKTIVYVTIDSIGGYTVILNQLRTDLLAAFKQKGWDLSADSVFVSANHSHNAPDMATVYNVWKNYDSKGTPTPVGAYWEYYMDRLTNAVVSAYENSVACTMSKSTVDASVETGYQLNFIRHIKFDDGNGGTVIQTNAAGEALYDADDRLHLLKFTPVVDDGVHKPTLMVNWRSHATITSASTYKHLSSDYAGPLRSFLEKDDYNVAFWQGAAGNCVPDSAEGKNTWKNFALPSGTTVDYTNGTTRIISQNNARYGYLLSRAVLAASGKAETVTAGPIRTIQRSYITDRQQDTEGLILAAKSWHDVTGGANVTVTYPYRYTYEGSVYILHNYYHANAVYNRNYNSAGERYSVATNAGMEINAIMLGNQVAMVTNGNELFDNYSLDNTLNSVLAGNVLDNDWNDLVDTSTYGTPFVLAYTNGAHNYMPNALSYTYNAGSQEFAAGCYESHTTPYAKGTGEKIITEYSSLLDTFFYDVKTEYCQACNQEVEWEPLTSAIYRKKISEQVTNVSGFGTGHYYLAENIEKGTGTFTVEAGEKTCLDLNGFSITNMSRSFYVLQNATLSIMDSKGTGEVHSISSAQAVGGTLDIRGTCNIYGGTYKNTTQSGKEGVSVGGVLGINNGTVNMYGGKIEGAVLDGEHQYPEYSALPGCGGAVYLYPNSRLNLSGNAEITSGQIPANGFGKSVFLHSSTSYVSLKDNAKVEEIYFGGAKEFAAVGGTTLTISGNYTGATTLSFNPEKVTSLTNLDIGTASNADISGADITCVNDRYHQLVVSGSNLVLKNNLQASVNGKMYTDIQAALNDAVDGQTVTVLSDITREITINNKAITLDLNGFDVQKVVVTGKEVYCMDSQTADYTIDDNAGYGRVASIQGNLLYHPDYYQIYDADGSSSFHRLDITITAMSLRASVAGVYYKCNFAGDEILAQNIESYGVALNIYEEPSSANMNTTTAYSSFKDFVAGTAGNAKNGTLLKNIMKPTNTVNNNIRNANIPIYGSSYVKFKNGDMMFGDVCHRSLKEQVEAVDALWNSYTEAAKRTVVNMYRRFENVMKNWNIPNIADSADDGITKILGIGNSYTQDSLWMLGEVYKKEKPGTKLELGIAYYSGCSLSSHVKFYNANDAVYEYNYYNSETDTWVTTTKMTLQQIIQAEEWDIVSLQQNSSASGLRYDNISTLRGFVENDLGYKPTYIWNMTWAVPEEDIPTDNYTLETAPNANSFKSFYQSSQAIMYKKIVECVQLDIVPDKEFTYLAPVGTAIQNANATFTDYDLYRDYTHLNDYGRLIAAYTWFCELEGITLDTIQVTTIPAALANSYKGGDYTLTEDQITVLVDAVKNAMTNKFVTTDTSVYE